MANSKIETLKEKARKAAEKQKAFEGLAKAANAELRKAEKEEYERCLMRAGEIVAEFDLLEKDDELRKVLQAGIATFSAETEIYEDAEKVKAKKGKQEKADMESLSSKNEVHLEV